MKKSGTIAVIGPLADSRGDMLGTWAMGGDPGKVTSILTGLKIAGGNSVNILYSKGSELTDNPMLAKAVNALGPAGQQTSNVPAHIS